MIQRLDDWPARLRRYVDARRRVEFHWGRSDCARWAGGAVEAVTGVDLLSALGLSGEYADAASAHAHLRTLGFRDLLEASCWVLQTNPRRAFASAMHGDLIYLPAAPIGCLGISYAPHVIFADIAGLRFVRREAVERLTGVYLIPVGA